MANFRKAGTNAFAAALAAAQTGNPYAIGGAAAIGGATGLLTPKRTFDANPFRRAFKTYETGVRSSARTSAAEAGSQIGTANAAQGLSRSPLGSGIVAGQRRLALQRGEDQINMARGALEADIAGAEESIRQANDAELRSDLAGVAQAGVSLAHNVATTNSPLRAKLGLPRIKQPGEDLLGLLQQGGTTAAAPAAIPNLDYSSTKADISKKLLVRGIRENSKYGQAHFANPARMQELEDFFTAERLDFIFGDR